jgi:hypothetical protein
MLEKQQLTILLHDRESQNFIPRSNSVKVIELSDLDFRLDDLKELTRYIFVLTSLTGLTEVADLVRVANQKHHLRALLIREDIDAQWLPQIFDRANLRTMRNTMVYTNLEIPKRVLDAWQFGMQDRLIAKATVIEDSLLVLSCSLEELEISFGAMPALQHIPENERNDFIISEEGSYIYWEEADIHLDLDAFRSALDPIEKQKFENLRLHHDKLLGQAMKALREQYKLKQSDIAGLSERQVRRIESGERTKVKTLELLAKAHDMDLSKYLNKVAGLIDETSIDNLLLPFSETEK